VRFELMKCPVDKSDMIVVEHEKIEIDHCLRCSGVWLDSGELQLLVNMLKSGGASAQTDLLTPHEVKPAKDRRKCPVCGHKMRRVWLGGKPKVIVDSCPMGDGLWFDSGELQQVLREMEPPKTAAAGDIVSFLGNAFQSTHGTDRKR
jgi:Zn-finger nucleic acid-binding protein